MTQAGPAIPMIAVTDRSADAGPALRVTVVADGRPTEAGPARPVIVVSDGRPTQGNEPVPVVLATGVQAAQIMAGPAMPVVVVGGGNLDPSLVYTNLIKAMSPIAYWPMAEASGAVALDASGNGRNGAYTGVTLGNAGIGDGRTAASFNGTTSRNNIYSASLAGAFSGSEGSFVVWCQVANAGIWTDGGVRTAIALWASANNRAEVIKNSTNYQVVFVYGAGGVILQFPINLFATLRPFMLALTWSKTADQAKVYVDGIQQGATQTGLGTWAGALASTTTVIGARSTVPASVWSGSLAHAEIFNRALSASEIASLYPAWLPRVRALVIEGDSRSIANTYNVLLATQIDLLGHPATITAVASKTVQTMAANVASVYPGIYYSDSNNIAIIWGGVNDGIAGRTAAQIYADLVSYCAAVRALGYKIVVCTEIDANVTNWHATTWPALNALIRGDTSIYDRLADLGANANLQDFNNATYFNADKVHLVAAGYTVVAGIIAAQVATL